MPPVTEWRMILMFIISERLILLVMMGVIRETVVGEDEVGNSK